MSEPASGWLDRDGVSLHYLEWAPEHSTSRSPAILLLHGLSSNARYWDRVARYLGRHRLIAIDQRGHGWTGRPPHAPAVPHGYDMKSLLDDSSFVIAQLHLRRPVVVGHSWGATVALELAATRPELVSGLVFIDGPVQSPSHLFNWEEAQRLMQPPLPRFRSMNEAIDESRRDLEAAWDADLEPFVADRLMTDGEALVLTLTAPVRLEFLRSLYNSQPEALWPRLTVPSVALLASRSFARISRSSDRGVFHLQEIAPRVEVKWFDTPHDVPLYMPAEVAAEVERVAGLAAEGLRSEAPAGEQLQD
ncbi:MAG: alpha/beta hydrolase [Candidatus Dormibacteraeota bacterium]|nr:alpha/beta hydrolase [Candidatus Dormibacteraeota bacterium]